MTMSTTVSSRSAFAVLSCVKPVLLGLAGAAAFVAGLGCLLSNWRVMMDAITGNDHFFWLPIIGASLCLGGIGWALCAQEKQLISERVMLCVMSIATALFIFIAAALVRSAHHLDTLSYYRWITLIVLSIATVAASICLFGTVIAVEERQSEARRQLEKEERKKAPAASKATGETTT
jgi:hypothetical protein